jgi:hypothetical protein
MKKLTAFAFVMGLLATSAQAMPLVPDQGSVSMITKVAEGCGLGRHRGPLGGCVPDERGAVVVAPGAVVVVPGVGPCRGRGQHEVCVVGRGCRMVCN